MKDYLNSLIIDELARDILDSEKCPIPSAGNQTNFKDKVYLQNVKALIKEIKTVHDQYRALNDVESYNLAVKAFPYFKERVDAHKKNTGILDFFDCLYKVKTGLKENESLRKLIQKRFSMIIVDEFQDSDPMQADIAFMLAEDDYSKLFFVGDPKQSIYGFARADISVYQGVMDKVSKMKEGQLVDLTTNFRSSNGVLKFVNDNFKQILTRSQTHPEITVDYDAMDVSPKNKTAPGGVSKWLLEMETGDELDADDWREREAFCIASKIKEMIGKGYGPGDFLILFYRSTSMADYEDALEKLGVPVVNTKSRDFLSQSEVIDMLNIIAHVAFPKDKYFKACAEKSVLLKHVPQEKIKVILESELSMTFKLEEIFNLCELKEASLQKKDDRLLQLKINLMSLLEVELDVTGYDLKQTVHNLFKKATHESFTASIKLDDQSIYVETTAPNAVRLMTIHAAKGLESKVVIISAHAKPKELKGSHFINRENDTFYPNCDLLPTDAAETLAITDLQNKLAYINLKKQEEEKRVLYVAATRAIESLVILDWDKKRSEFMSRLMDLQKLSFDEVIPVDFNKHEKSFTDLGKYNKGVISNLASLHTAEALSKLLETKNVSKAVTSIISDKELFKDIGGRKRGMEFGVLTHSAMETIALHLFSLKNTQIDTDQLVSRINERMGMNFDATDVEELKRVCRSFLVSPMASELMLSDSLGTEVPFVTKGDVHGVMDLVFSKGNSIRIVDWKSDKLISRGEEIKLHYKKQIAFYEKVLPQSSGSCFYLFAGDK